MTAQLSFGVFYYSANQPLPSFFPGHTPPPRSTAVAKRRIGFASSDISVRIHRTPAPKVSPTRRSTSSAIPSTSPPLSIAWKRCLAIASHMALLRATPGPISSFRKSLRHRPRRPTPHDRRSTSVLVKSDGVFSDSGFGLPFLHDLKSFVMPL